ncbi:all-trans retinoic acid-induced differentiation factor-like isoform X2 [Dysidea avara]|uniref:all-trans retinoic acid-induced differentiation factor-like isoform X2 n=1 Tax=Dysidea avara TaxID=196820 RepID=UPI003327E065
MHQIFYLSLVGVLLCIVECQLCSKCSDNEQDVSGDSIIKSLCSNTTGAALNQRCCVLHDNVMGLDWSECNITELHSYQFASIGDSLLWLDLSGNNVPLEYFNASLRLLGGLNNLQLLLLPVGTECNTDAWEESTIVQDTMLCSEPVLCNVSQSTSLDNIIPIMNVSNNSGLHQCVCNNGHHGYKCIQKKGPFPYILFFSVSIATCVVIVAADYIIKWWLIRKPKR